MDKELIRSMLPHEPPAWYNDWIEVEAAGDLDVDLMLFSAERVSVWPERTELTDMATYRPIKKIWQTRCTCTRCGEDFVTRHIPQQGGVKGFAMYQGEDGCLYPLDPVDGAEPVADHEIDDFGYDSNILEIGELDQVTCPWCSCSVTATHRSRLRGGRKKQILGLTVQNVGMYTTLFCWLTEKLIYDDGTYDLNTYPRDAYVIGERGGITRYRHTKGSAAGFQSEYRLREWEICGTVKDSFGVPYHDWESISNRKIGGAICDRIPFLGGCTGEKTGIEEYIKGGGNYPVTYIKLWYKHKRVENLVKAGWVRMVSQSIGHMADNYGYKYLSTQIEGIDWSKRKPHEMLRMGKAAFKEITGKRKPWDCGTFYHWAEYLDAGGQCPADQFDEYCRNFGASEIEALLQFLRRDHTDFPEALKYLEKQGLTPRDLQYLIDARQMARELYPDRPLTEAELWPRNLRAVHDHLMRLQAVAQDEKKNAALNEGFGKIIDMYGCLEWTDGELCIRLPKKNSDLIIEGKVLDHCVGRYGSGHVKGDGVIWFVRKYRRPERSYFTLDIKMTGGAPKEVQLHGYKNEWVGGTRKKQRSIPVKVRNFVDRWKREVLMPWWLAQINNEQKEKTA